MQKTSIKLVKTLQDKGFQSYWAGGCVRDMLLGKDPLDYDIVTSAKPEEIEQIISKTIPIGKQFGVILAIENSHHFEIATFRSDSGYSDGRRPDAVLFTKPEEDALRRDFTINGLFFDPISEQIHDFVGGLQDIRNKLIRFIGNPHDRILEDHLRIIRAIRFKNTLNFGYHPDTYKALKKHARLSTKVSGERLKQELDKILLSGNVAQAFEDLQDTGVLAEILPEIEAMKGIAQPMMYHAEGDVWNHSMLCVQSLPKDAPLNLRYATLMHDIGKPQTFKIDDKRIRFDHHAEIGADIARKILIRLKFSRKDMGEICWLIAHHMTFPNYFKMRKARRLHWFLKPEFPQLLQLFKADIKGTRPLGLETWNKLEKLYQKDLKANPAEPKKLLSGEEIMKTLKLPPGPQIGKILKKLRDLQVEDKIRTKKQAEKWLKKYQKS